MYTVDQLPPSIFLWDTARAQFSSLYTLIAPNSTPDWSPDSRFIIYTAFTGRGSMGIYRLDAADCLQPKEICNPQRLTTRTGIYAAPQWRPNTP